MHCGQSGATLGCCDPDCVRVFHFPCARSARCAFGADRSLFCPKHASALDDSNKNKNNNNYENQNENGIGNGNGNRNQTDFSTSSSEYRFRNNNNKDKNNNQYKNNNKDNKNNNGDTMFAIKRRTYMSPVTSWSTELAFLGVEKRDRKATGNGNRVRVGGLTLCSLGRVTTKYAAFHSESALYTVGFCAKRLFWSCVHYRKRW